MSEHFEISNKLERWVEGHGEPLTFSQASLVPDQDLIDGALNRLRQIRESDGNLSHEELLTRIRESGVPSAIAEIALYATVN